MLWACSDQTSATTTTTSDNHICGTACACGWSSNWNYWPITYRAEPEEKSPRVEPTCWQKELRATPRRMKRPFPADKSAKHKAYRRACY